MPLEISSLKELPPEKVDALLTTLAQLMQEQHPEVELTRGAFYDLVLYFNSVLNTAVRENIERVLQSKSLLQIINNPALAEPELVDQVLSNFNVARDAGTPANGIATVVVNLPVNTTIDTSIGFNVNGVKFYPTNTFVLLPPGSTPRDDNDKVLVAVGDGTYAANVFLQSSVTGTEGNIKRGTKLLPDYAPNNVLNIFAASDFVDGRNPSTNEEYLQKLSTGIAAKTIGGRKSYEAVLRAQPKFAGLLHCSVLGCGDVEQQRDQHGLFPISGGGKVDVYVQTNAYPQEFTEFVKATYVGPATAMGSRWKITIDRDLFPGFYEVSRISLPGDNTTNSYNIVTEVRGVNFDAIAYVPDIKYLPESAYTRYQTAVVQFENEQLPPTGLTPNVSTADYALTVKGLPLVSDIHDFLTARDMRSRGTDILVKAAVPCFTKIAFTVQTETNAPLADDVIVKIKKEIVQAISRIGFAGQLHSSIISGAAHKYLVGRQAIRNMDMFGRIRRPDGTAAYIRDNTLLRIPDDPQRLVTGRTTVFLVGESDISISSVAAGFTD